MSTEFRLNGGLRTSYITTEFRLLLNTRILFVASEESNLIVFNSSATEFPVSPVPSFQCHASKTTSFKHMPVVCYLVYTFRAHFIFTRSGRCGSSKVIRSPSCFLLYPAVCGSRINLIFVLPRYHPHLVYYA